MARFDLSAPQSPDQRIFVTGGSGFIGTNLVAAYLRQGVSVMNFDCRPPQIEAHRSVWRDGDIRDLPALITSILGFEPTVLFHLAARTDLEGRRLADYSSNTLGVANVIAATQRLPVSPRVVFASSRLVCEIGYVPRTDTDWRPSTHYGASKVRGEQIVRERCLNTPWVITRPTSIWGPWFGEPYRNFFEAVLGGRYLHPRGRIIRKSFGYVENTVYQLQQLARVSTEAVAGRVFYLADYEPLELGEMAAAISQAANAPRPRAAPILLLRILARAGDALQRCGWRSPPLTSFRLTNLLTDMVFDPTALRDTVGQLPVVWREGIRRTIAWLQDEAGGPGARSIAT
jgi:GlcNAc-P-P-Und epimerase